MLGAGALGRPRGMVWGGRRERGSGWGTRVYQWRMHVDIWQNQYNIVKLKNKIIFFLKKDHFLKQTSYFCFMTFVTFCFLLLFFNIVFLKIQPLL